jgi:AcrR family transcriptional regulator
MEKMAGDRLRRTDWIHEALTVLQEKGVSGIRIVQIAKRLKVTSGSFYWHFKNLSDLHDCLLKYWESELTDSIVTYALGFKGSPEDRILKLMLMVIENDAAKFDSSILVWAKNDQKVLRSFERTLNKRFDFAAWMFEQAGFPRPTAKARGRLMVAYLIGESSTDIKLYKNWRAIIKEQHRILTAK